jgi:hypothetical protein
MLCGIALLCTAPALAADVSLSGFGTIGYAKSDQSYNYQRFINDDGTLKRDSVLGVQMAAQFNPTWSATVQAKVAPALDNDTRIEPTISWAFLSYRPSNDWMIRVGKLRMPFYLNTENLDVGYTYDYARLPNELYSVSPTMDFNGATFLKTWNLADSELDLDGYWGEADMPWRHFNRDSQTAYWSQLKNNAKGLVLTLRDDDDSYRMGLHAADIWYADGHEFPEALAPTTLPPASGMSGTYYSPASYSSKIQSPAFNLGADVGWENGFRTTGEYVRRRIVGMSSGPDTESYYLSLLKQTEQWTPYVTYAKIMSRNLDIYQNVNSAQVTAVDPTDPVAVGTAAGINAAQREAADSMSMYDQHSWAIGTSYALDLKSKIKAEWMIVQTGAVSSFVDAPAGEESGDRRINVFSLSYNFVF